MFYLISRRRCWALYIAFIDAKHKGTGRMPSIMTAEKEVFSKNNAKISRKNAPRMRKGTHILAFLLFLMYILLRG